jgi:hypothetical protein
LLGRDWKDCEDLWHWRDFWLVRSFWRDWEDFLLAWLFWRDWEDFLHWRDFWLAWSFWRDWEDFGLDLGRCSFRISGDNTYYHIRPILDVSGCITVFEFACGWVS